ncbi:hypothetical protein H7I53_13060 [Mycolicibacterium pulveris]|uniref:PE-PGRS family protein n=1 Tax=Mycolicibacterium pulveris TaxID=36813 RepID=A0A7I7UNM7_MYCPV|nr:hypothetical protein [Mycolicibacterium pulveris]MCV6981151.1 hypothetical protein [Mycolicibacterium pulveris]BBY82411.1 hypothetical protein MPUL_35690 [Mycolicibacterium pulveris]
MQGAIRPYLTAGVALVGASVIAVSPVAPPVPDIKVGATPSVSSAMQLASATNPLAALGDLFGNTGNSLNGLVQQVAADPAPILAQLVINQGHALQYFVDLAQEVGGLLPDIAQLIQQAAQTIVTQLGEGDITGAGQTLSQTLVFSALPLAALLVPPLNFASNITQNIANVAAAVNGEFIFQVLLPVIYPVMGSINGGADILQTAYDAVRAGDLVGAVGALVSAPIVMTDTILNGFGDFAGLLTPHNAFGFNGGIVASLLGFRTSIADALKPISFPYTPPDVQYPSALAAATDVTLSTEVEEKAPEAVGASSGEAESGVTSLANTGGTDESGVAGAEEQEGEAPEAEAPEEEAPEEEAPVDDSDVDGSEEDADEDENAGSGQIRESLVAVPGQTGLGTGGDDGGESETANTPANTAGGSGDDGGSENDGDAGGSESGGSGGDE